MNKSFSEIRGLRKPDRRPDLLLINSPINDYNKIPKPKTEELPAFGLAFIATECESAGFNVGVLDAEGLALTPEYTAKVVNEANPRWVGMNMLTPTYHLARRILVNLDSKIPIILGAAHAQALPEKTLRDPLVSHKIKAIVLGDGEYIVKGILQNINFKNIEGIAYLNKLNNFVCKPYSRQTKWIPQNLDSLNFVNRKFLSNDPFASQGRIEASIVSSRGCPFFCNFCVGSYKNPSLAIRRRSPENIVKEMKLLQKQGVSAVRFIDDLFLIDKEFIENFTKQLIKSGLNKVFVWDANGRADILSKLDKNLLEQISFSGCREIALGIESASQRILNLMRKNITPQMVRKCVTSLATLGINTKGYFVLGYPSETKKEMESTVSFMHELRYLARKNKPNNKECPNKGQFRSSVFEFRPYPGTLIYDYLTNKKPWPKGFWKNTKIASVYTEDEILASFRPVFMAGLEERQKHNYTVDHPFASGVLPYEIQDMIARAMSEQKEDIHKHGEYLPSLCSENTV